MTENVQNEVLRATADATAMSRVGAPGGTFLLPASVLLGVGPAIIVFVGVCGVGLLVSVPGLLRREGCPWPNRARPDSGGLFRPSAPRRCEAA
ncbi:MAG TPA: hypothetical protein VKK19_14825 [Candidatus Dormibacteraeota bacterium]|nr:hypothetical protein [Candidatus Dormibacteraeota bacterium]